MPRRASRFDAGAREMMVAGEISPLVDCGRLGWDAALAIPTPDHFLPLLSVLATRQPDGPVRCPVCGIDGGSVSVTAVQVG